MVTLLKRFIALPRKWLVLMIVCFFCPAIAAIIALMGIHSIYITSKKLAKSQDRE